MIYVYYFVAKMCVTHVTDLHCGPQKSANLFFV